MIEISDPQKSFPRAGSKLKGLQPAGGGGGRARPKNKNKIEIPDSFWFWARPPPPTLLPQRKGLKHNRRIGGPSFRVMFFVELDTDRGLVHPRCDIVVNFTNTTKWGPEGDAVCSYNIWYMVYGIDPQPKP